MNRTTLWLAFWVSSLIYQTAKLGLGFTPDYGSVFDCAYWSGAVLLIEHFQNRLPGKMV